MQRTGTLLMFLGVIILAACQNSSGLEVKGTVEPPSQTPSDIDNPAKTISPQPIVTDDIETICPSRTLPTIEPDASLYEVTTVPPGYIAGIRWPIEYEQIFLFAHSSVEPGKLQWWAYDLLSKELQPIDQAIAIEETSTDFNDLPIEVDTSMPGSFELVNISPSGEKVLFLEGTGPPTATPPPNPDGELDDEAFIANLWVWEKGSKYTNLGQIEICSRNRYMWTADEDQVAIQALPFPSSCRQANAWLSDTVDNVIKPLLPFEIYSGEAELVGFSPNEDRMLIYHWGPDEYGIFTPVGILDIDTGSVFKADIQATPLDWVNNNQILIEFSNTPEEVLRPGILDLRSNEVIELFTREQTSLFEGKTIRWISLSPDKQWLVFTVDHEPYKMSSLWVMQLRLK